MKKRKYDFQVSEECKEEVIHCKDAEYRKGGKDDDCWTYRADIVGLECSNTLPNKSSGRPTDIYETTPLFTNDKPSEIAKKEILG